MAPRKPLAPISTNRRPRQQLSVETKQAIYSARQHGMTMAEIAKLHQVPTSTVKANIYRIDKRGSFDAAPRSGRPSQITPRDERRILRAIRNNSHLTFEELRREAGVDVARVTLMRLLTRLGIAPLKSGKVAKGDQSAAAA